MIDLFKHLKGNAKKYLFFFFEIKKKLLFSGLIYNIAAKYGLERTQISVSSVEDHGLTSFQIMPFFNENMEIFDQKMEQIDIDVMKEKKSKLKLKIYYLFFS
jgi:hypothetical protein